MSRDDLVSMYLDSQLPSGWAPRDWGLLEAGQVVSEMHKAEALLFPKLLKEAQEGNDSDFYATKGLAGLLGSLGLNDDPDPVNPTIRRAAPQGVLEAINTGSAAFPSDPVQTIVGGPLCPIDGLYDLSSTQVCKAKPSHC